MENYTEVEVNVLELHVSIWKNQKILFKAFKDISDQSLVGHQADPAETSMAAYTGNTAFIELVQQSH